jgi:hypothetical protein
MRRVVLVIALATTGVLFTVSPVSATERSAANLTSVVADVADENNTAVYEPGGDGASADPNCNEIYGGEENTNTLWLAGQVCYVPSAERIYVYDAWKDGYAVSAQWENYLRDPNGNWVLYRRGHCTNSLGFGNWGYCQKNFYQDDTYPNAVGGQGSGLRIYACLANVVCNGTETWVRNDPSLG